MSSGADLWGALAGLLVDQGQSTTQVDDQETIGRLLQLEGILTQEITRLSTTRDKNATKLKLAELTTDMELQKAQSDLLLGFQKLQVDDTASLRQLAGNLVGHYTKLTGTLANKMDMERVGDVYAQMRQAGVAAKGGGAADINGAWAAVQHDLFGVAEQPGTPINRMTPYGQAKLIEQLADDETWGIKFENGQLVRTKDSAGEHHLGEDQWAQIQQTWSRNYGHLRSINKTFTETQEARNTLNGYIDGVAGTIGDEELKALAVSSLESQQNLFSQGGLLDAEQAALEANVYGEELQAMQDREQQLSDVQAERAALMAGESQIGFDDVVGDPDFQEWAKQAGLNVGHKTPDGGYVPGRQDRRAVEKYLREAKRGPGRYGFLGLGLGQGTTGDYVEVFIPPSEPRLYWAAMGDAATHNVLVDGGTGERWLSLPDGSVQALTPEMWNLPQYEVIGEVEPEWLTYTDPQTKETRYYTPGDMERGLDGDEVPREITYAEGRHVRGMEQRLHADDAATYGEGARRIVDRKTGQSVLLTGDIPHKETLRRAEPMSKAEQAARAVQEARVEQQLKGVVPTPMEALEQEREAETQLTKEEQDEAAAAERVHGTPQLQPEQVGADPGVLERYERFTPDPYQEVLSTMSPGGIQSFVDHYEALAENPPDPNDALYQISAPGPNASGTASRSSRALARSEGAARFNHDMQKHREALRLLPKFEHALKLAEGTIGPAVEQDEGGTQGEIPLPPMAEVPEQVKPDKAAELAVVETAPVEQEGAAKAARRTKPTTLPTDQGVPTPAGQAPPRDVPPTSPSNKAHRDQVAENIGTLQKMLNRRANAAQGEGIGALLRKRRDKKKQEATDA